MLVPALYIAAPHGKIAVGGRIDAGLVSAVGATCRAALRHLSPVSLAVLPPRALVAQNARDEIVARAARELGIHRLPSIGHRRRVLDRGGRDVRQWRGAAGLVLRNPRRLRLT